MTIESVHATDELAWSFPEQGESAYVLHCHDKPIGWLRFEKDPGANSIAEWEGRRWTFERTGAHHAPVTMRCQGSEEAAAVFIPWSTGGGIAVLRSGARYCWNRKQVLSATYCFRGEENKSAVCVTQESGPLVAGGTVHVCADAVESPDTPILVLLAWYLRILEFQRLSESIFGCG